MVNRVAHQAVHLDLEAHPAILVNLAVLPAFLLVLAILLVVLASQNANLSLFIECHPEERRIIISYCQS
uniref:Uncharacterized protein n=1 Tax=Pararge aegeria TaxID=116150 RepID=S4P111_9NEOP